MTWFCYEDTLSGGYEKTPYRVIIIEAESEEAADRVFEKRFDRHPKGESCYCCTEDFYMSGVSDDLEKLKRNGYLLRGDVPAVAIAADGIETEWATTKEGV